MIETSAPVATAESRPRRGRRRRRTRYPAVLGAVLVVAVLLVAVLLVSDALVPAASAPVFVPAPVPTTAAPPSPTAAAAPVAAPRKLPAKVPTRGAGTFTYAPGRGKVLGTKGKLRRFRVAVERGGGEDVADFAAQVEATLGDKRSWVGNGGLRLQRVSGGEAASFTVYLATRDTAGRMCRIGGVNITVHGRPYTSCRATGRVIINLDRWRLSARPYLEAKVPLSIYRQYVINHETGHELGHHHEGCPRRGGPAPVMVQQSLTLRGCVPYAWPRRANHRFAGPSL